MSVTTVKHNIPRGSHMRLERNTVRIFTMLAIVTTAGCSDEANRLTMPVQRDLGIASSTINVANVDQLYAAVNNSANAGASIVLAPGSYVLTLTDGSGAPRPNKGRLELQQDMSLYGMTGNRNAVSIDATHLPDSAFNVSFGRTAPVRIGRGTNAIEWLTVLGNVQAAASIATELTGTPSTRVRVAHVTAAGSSRG